MSRSRLPLVLTAAAAVMLAAFAVRWAAVSPREIRLSDFTGTYVGATLLREGHGAGVYDLHLQSSLHAALIAPLHEGNLPFVNPPPAALLAMPVSLLPLAVAYRVWQVAQLAMLLAAVVLVALTAPWPPRLRRPPWAPVCAIGVALAGIATLSLGLLGQWDGFSALGLAAAYALWTRERRALGALVLAATALAAKPHLALGLAAFLLAWRDRRVLAGALGGLALVAVVSLATVGPGGIATWMSATRADTGLLPTSTTVGLNGLAASWLGDGAASQALALAGVVVALTLCLWLGARVRRDGSLLEPCLAGATALSLVASPHLLRHDPVLLAPVLVALLAWTSRRERERTAWPGRVSRLVLYGWVLLNLAGAVDLSAAVSAPPGRLTPLALAGAGVALVVVASRGTAAAGSRPPVLALSSRRAS